ncbi:MAG: GAF domain-containing protein, partial [Cyanobacteria bacterium P01_H01_bin.150]
MTSAYQENTENGHHFDKVEHSDTLSELSSATSDSTTKEQSFKNWRIQLSSILNQIRKAKNLEELVQLTTAVVKEKIQSDRVMLYRFNSSSSGVVIGESISNGWTPAMDETIPAMIFGLDAREEYLEAVSINDIKEVELTAYKAQILEKFQVTASLTIPIFVHEQIWGLLGIQNCVTARQWEESEIT